MEQEPSVKITMRSEALTVLLNVISGSGIAWIVWLATGSIVLAIGMAGPMAALANNILRKVMTRTKRG